MTNITKEFFEYALNAEQWSLDNELFVNVDYNNFELVDFLLKDSRLPLHANINNNNGRCFYICKSEKMLQCLIVEYGLRMTSEIYKDIINKKVNFPEESLRLFKITELYHKIKSQYPKKDLKLEKKLKI